MAKKQWLWVGLVVLAAAALGMMISQNSANSSTSVPAEISISEAAALRNEVAFILDVRQPEEWEQVHIPGAVLIPLGELPNRIQEVPQDQRVVVVCRSGNRSAQAADLLRSKGYDLVSSMAGGMNQWGAAGYDTATGK